MFNPRKSAGAKRVKLSTGEDRPFFLYLYNQPPEGEISIQQIETLTSERIKLLRLFEVANTKFQKFSTEWTDFMFKEIKDFEKVFAFKFTDDADYETKLRNDVISHYFVRLPYCRTDDLRKWLLAHEVDLFKFRFLRLQNDSSHGKNLVTKFLSAIQLSLKIVSSGEKNAHDKWLKACLGGQAVNFDNIEFYKVHFTQAIDLVRNRRAFLHNGSLYVPHIDVSSIVLNHFRASLSQQLAHTTQRLTLMEDDRITPKLVAISNQYLGRKFGQEGGAVTVDQIEQLATQSFPLCMSNIHVALKETKHAKHWARLQYGLFLKAIGLSADDALVFWRKYLTKNADGEAFDKKYAYLFRHMYGKEGKKTSYSPYSCIKIQNNSAPGTADEFHGCPYKHNPINVLSSKLEKVGLVKSEINEVTSLVQSKNYCMACTKTFELKHRISENVLTAITHPNQYYEESRKVLTTGNVSARMRGGGQAEAADLTQFKAQHESMMEDRKKSGFTQQDADFLSQSASVFDEDF